MNYHVEKLSNAFLVFLGVAAVLGFMAYGVQGSLSNAISQNMLAGLSFKASLPPYKNMNVADPQISAESALAIETNLNGADMTLFEKEGDKTLPIASLTKLMTAVVALENYQISQAIPISQQAVMQEGKNGSLKMGDKISVKDLLFIMLIESSNHAAYALADYTGQENFVALMNQKAKDLGLSNTYFADATGLSAQNYSTSKDLAKLTEYLFKNYPIITEISRTKETDLYRLDGTYYGKLENTNQLLGEIPEIVGGKTGFTTNAKGCLMLVLNNQQNNDFLVYVILGAEDRFSEMKKIIEWVNFAYHW